MSAPSHVSATGLILSDVEIGYRGRHGATVASGITAQARPGELTALIGPNGAGKSTLLRTICGLQPSLGGRVELSDGTSVERLGRTALARRVAVVTTDSVDPGRLSAREVVGLGRTPYLAMTGKMSAADHRIVEESIDAVAGQSLAARPFIDLSDGEKQRILAARALAQEPELLVLDEPTSHLDAPSRVEFCDLLRTLAREQQITVLLSSHELELMMRVADHLWLLGPDGTMAAGSPRELADRGDIGATFDRGRLTFDPDHFVFNIAEER
ncbi:ABC transporter ATP-binding protein [Gordonia phthalatica]|uniref:ABC transporter ATPase n=1 Tax=Gordonia phthalatica TaxID=1136941 RepID=A0A0N9NDI0_9ACTN|nr:ABC transporter ATP-binding protein [Gordonia phthalatica]ALG83593.1 ABC transporter ATPase [Gordonia phthalatica]